MAYITLILKASVYARRPLWRFKIRITTIHIALSVLTLFGSPQALAADVEYSIDKQPLATALTRYAEQSELQILFRSLDIPNADVESLIGTYSHQDALTLLLKDTNLQFTFGGNNAVVIHAAPESPAPVLPQDLPVPERSPATNSNANLNTVDEVWVTGIRNSLKRNLTVKQQANAIVDLITSEDVGKFPDKNIADALQRIPGVSVDRIWGEGRDINIRGTDKDINRTLMNGQNVASAYWWANDNPGRGFNYSILASELISSLAVYKSPEADIDEGSIGGTVVIHTHKPFDVDNKVIRLTLEEHYSELPNAWDPQLSFFTNWKNDAETFGVLASFNWQNRTMRRDGLEAFPDNSLYTIIDDQGQTHPDTYVIWGGGSAIFQQERERQTNNLTVQWAPTTAWNAVFNYVESNLDMINSNQNYLFMPGGFKLRETPPVIVSDPRFGTTGDGRQTLLGGTMGNADSTGAALDAIFRQAYVRSAVYDVDVTYRSDAWSLHTQAGVTTAQGGSDHDKLYRFVGNTRERFSLSNNSIEIEYLDLDPKNASSLTHFSDESRDWIRTMEDRENYAQVDYELELNHPLFSALKTGLKWRDQVIENNRTVGSINSEHPAWAELHETSLAAVSDSLTPQLHEQTASEKSLTQFAWANLSLLENLIDPQLQNGLMTYHFDNAAFYKINEKISAGYIKADIATGSWRGNIGIRAAHTRQYSTALSTEKLTEQRNYTDSLPSFNIAYDVDNDIIWRFSAAKVMARPTFQNVSTNIVIDATNGTASQGNPDLEPFRAKQFDTGVEWYFSEAAILSANYFYKNISTFIYNESFNEIINDQPLTITRPYNAEGATISGIELQWQQDLINGFGWLSNYTYTDASVRSPDEQQVLKLPGNSRDQINASIYYEKNLYDFRLSYNYRSKSFGELVSGSQDETNSYQQWDFTASYTPIKNVTVFIEGINLTNQVIYYRTANNIPQGLYENGRRFAIGTRLRF